MVGLRLGRKKQSSAVTTIRRFQRGRPINSKVKVTRAEALERLKHHHAAAGRKMAAEIDRRSLLEKLPVELIQHIFFFSLEINLPRASVYLCEVLSTEQIYNALTIFAYFDDDGVSPVEEKFFLPAEYRSLDLDEKIRLQRNLFTCRWGNAQRIFACIPALTRLAMGQAWHREKALEESHRLRGGGDTVIVANTTIAQLAPLPDPEDEHDLEAHFFVHGRGHQESYPAYVTTWTSSLDDQGVIHKTTDQYVPTTACRHFPDKLLKGPWNKDDINLIRLFRQGYASIQDGHSMSISATALFDGMRRAIASGHAMMLTVLMDLHNVLFKSGSWGIQHMMSTQLVAATNHPLPLDIFHLATMQHDTKPISWTTNGNVIMQAYGLDTMLVSTLIRGAIDSLPRDDEVLTAWALKRARSGNDVANFVLQYMEGTASYGLPRRRHLFVDGATSWRAEDVPLSSQSFAEELEYTSRTPIVPSGIDGRNCGDELG